MCCVRVATPPAPFTLTRPLPDACRLQPARRGPSPALSRDQELLSTHLRIRLFLPLARLHFMSLGVVYFLSCMCVYITVLVRCGALCVGAALHGMHGCALTCSSIDIQFRRQLRGVREH